MTQQRCHDVTLDAALRARRCAAMPLDAATVLRQRLRQER